MYEKPQKAWGFFSEKYMEEYFIGYLFCVYHIFRAKFVVPR